MTSTIPDLDSDQQLRSSPIMQSISRSSRELSASALERDKTAKEAAERKAALLAQIESLQNQARAEEEKELQEREQAEADRQAAQVKKFHEGMDEKQADFRRELADNVVTRVASNLHVPAIRTYVESVAQNQSRAEDTSLFKEMLWSAVAGDEAGFLPTLAAKALDRSLRHIDDDDNDDIERSYACLDATKPALDTSSALPQIHSPDVSPQIDGTTGVDTSESIEQSAEVSNGIVDGLVGDKLEQQDVEQIKRESTMHERPLSPPSERVQIDDIEIQHDTQPNIPGVNDTFEDTELDALVQDTAADLVSNSSEITKRHTEPMESKPPATPKTIRKRAIDEDDDAESVATSSSKKAKTSSQQKSPVQSKLFKHFDALAKQGKLTMDHFHCSSCGKAAVNPRVTAKCHHVYCHKCLTDLRGNAKGKYVAKTKCCHVGCKSSTGAASKIIQSELDDLKETFLKELEETESDGDGQTFGAGRRTTKEEVSSLGDRTDKSGDEDE